MITNTPRYPDWVMWEQELSADTCEKIIEACSDLESHGATTCLLYTSDAADE